MDGIINLVKEARKFRFQVNLRMARHAGLQDQFAASEVDDYCKLTGLDNGSAGDGRQALDMLRSAAAMGQPYDLVLLDRHMPEMDGIELAHRIRSDPEIPSPRLVVLSSVAHDDESALASDAGIDRYLLNRHVRPCSTTVC